MVPWRNISRFASPCRSNFRQFISSAPPDQNDSRFNLPQSKYFPPSLGTMLPSHTFQDKVVFITGGGTGIGKGMTLKFSELGAKVIIASRRLEVLQSTSDEIEAITRNKVLPIALDVRNPEKVEEAVDTVINEIGRIPDIVVNNAAGNFLSPTEKVTPKGFKTIVDIVLNGTANVTLEIGKRMIKEKSGGVFLSIVTHYTNEGSGFVCPSACAKAGVETMMKSLAAEWGRYGIRMNCIAPGLIYTDGAFSRLDPTGTLTEEFVKTIPVGRIGRVEEIANLATYLCSDYGSWISAETVTLDGGEFRSLAGEFNKLLSISPEMWNLMGRMAQENKEKYKNK